MSVAKQSQILVWAGQPDRVQRIEAALAGLVRGGAAEFRHQAAPEAVLSAVLDDQADLLIADLDEVAEREVLTLRSCRRARPRLPLIVITSVFGERFRSGVLPLGVHFYLAADFVSAELDESVRSALGLSVLPGSPGPDGGKKSGGAKRPAQ